MPRPFPADQLQAIVQGYRQGVSLSKLARILSVSPSSIRRVYQILDVGKAVVRGDSPPLKSFLLTSTEAYMGKVLMLAGYGEGSIQKVLSYIARVREANVEEVSAAAFDSDPEIREKLAEEIANTSDEGKLLTAMLVYLGRINGHLCHCINLLRQIRDGDAGEGKMETEGEG